MRRMASDADPACHLDLPERVDLIAAEPQKHDHISTVKSDELVSLTA